MDRNLVLMQFSFPGATDLISQTIVIFFFSTESLLFLFNQ